MSHNKYIIDQNTSGINCTRTNTFCNNLNVSGTATISGKVVFTGDLEVDGLETVGEPLANIDPTSQLEVLTNPSQYAISNKQYGSTLNACYQTIVSRGSKTLPSAIQANDSLMSLVTKGYGLTNYQSTQPWLQLNASQNWSDTATGTKISLSTIPNGSTTPVTALTINQDSTINLAQPLGVPYGGTGLSTSPSNGNLLIGNGSTYTLATITPTTNQTTVSNGSGSIIVGTVQDIGTTSQPTFAQVTLGADPTMPLQACTKEYADSLAAGFTFKEACYASTITNLNATYINGSSGVGATLTNAGADAAFTADGTSPGLNARILVYSQTTQSQNGIYSVTTVGDSKTPWVLTRTTDFDTAAEIIAGVLVPVDNGTENTNTVWLCTTTVSTIGTDPINFNIFSYAASYFLQVANNLSDVESATTSATNLGLGTGNSPTFAGLTLSSPLTIANGGTSLSSTPTNGQLLIGDTKTSNYVLSTITGTSNEIIVTNAGGSITLSTPQAIASTSTPTFAGLTLNGSATTESIIPNSITGAYNLGNALNEWGTVYSNYLYGQIQTGNQSLITNVGTLLTLTMGGNINLGGNVITNGSWQGSAVSGEYGGTGVDNSGLTINLSSGTSGYVLTSDSSGNATWGPVSSIGVSSATGTANQVLVNNTSGSPVSGDITLTTPQSIGTSSSPKFSSLTLTSNLIVDGDIQLNGASSGTITCQTQSASGTYNWNFPTTAGTSGYFLTSAGGGSAAMTWTNPGSISVTSCQGTANQVLVNNTSGSPVAGAITLTTPQPIGTSSSVQFGQLTLTSGLVIDGSSSGSVNLGAISGTYNWNFPTSAGTSGYALLSGGGGSSPMTWSNIVSSLSGTSNQVSVSASVGSVTISLPSTVQLPGTLSMGSSPNASALLTMVSTTQGFLPPAMTYLQKTAISSPATGLLVHDTTGVYHSYYNGTNWTPVIPLTWLQPLANTYKTRTGAHSSMWKSVAWSPSLGLFCMVSEGLEGTGDIIQTSPNGITWTLQTAAANVVLNSIIWDSGHGHFSATCSNGSSQYSSNGTSWTSSSTTITSGRVTNQAYSPSLNIIVAVNGVNGKDVGTPSAWYSSDGGVNWTGGTGTADGAWCVCWGDTPALFVAVNQNSSLSSNQLAYSSNGTSWTLSTSAVGAYCSAIGWSHDLGIFIAAGGTSASNLYTSTNGTTWTSIGGSFADSNVSNIVWSPDLQVFILTTQAGYIYTSLNGTSWILQDSSAFTFTPNSCTYSQSNGIFCMACAGASGSGTTSVLTSQFLSNL